MGTQRNPLSHLRKSVTIRESNHASGVYKEHGRITTVKSQLSERQLSETTGLFEDDGQSRLFSLLSVAIKLPIMRISIIGKNQFFEVIRRSR